MDWQEHYKRKLVTAEEAVKLVKSGDRVEIAMSPTPYGLAARPRGSAGPSFET